MSKRKPRRSREFKKNSQVIDIEEARRQRREKRQKAAKAETRKRAAAQQESAAVSVRKKAKKNRRRLVYAAIILFIIAVIAVSAFNIFSLLHERAELRKEQERLSMIKDRLEQELESVNSPEYIEQQARSHLRLIKPGETLYILPKSSNQETEDSSGTAENTENGQNSSNE